MRKQRRTERDVKRMLDREDPRALDTNSALPLGIEECMLRGTKGGEDRVTVCMDDLGRFVTYLDVGDEERRSYGWTLDEEVVTGRLIPARLARDGEGRWDGVERGPTPQTGSQGPQTTVDDLLRDPARLQEFLKMIRFDIVGKVYTCDELVELATDYEMAEDEDEEDER